MDSATGKTGTKPSTDYEIIVVGGGVAGCFAAATAADAGAEVLQIERKSAENAGHIACGDAIRVRPTRSATPGRSTWSLSRRTTTSS